MLMISHRGNVEGPISWAENSPGYIDAALRFGFDVEVDVWGVNGRLMLGHDAPQYILSEALLRNNHMWFHCKNVAALEVLQKQNVRYFWHENDAYTLTSNGKIWTYPGQQLVPGAIAVLPEIEFKGSLSTCYGICTDFVHRYLEMIS